MNSRPHISGVLECLRRLSGSDYGKVLSCLGAVHEEYAKLDERASQFFETCTESNLSTMLELNRAAFTCAEPAQESVFVYFDVSASAELQHYVARVGKVIGECLGPHQPPHIRLSDAALQHVTAFVEMEGANLNVDPAMLETAEREYGPILENFLPFNILINGPHIFQEGGVVLGGEVYSEQFYELRKLARQKVEHVPKHLSRSIHLIVHSTIGYITRASANQLMHLHQTFAAMRSQNAGIRVRIRDARIAATNNKRVVGDPVIVPLGGTRRNQPTKGEALAQLQELGNRAGVWLGQSQLRNCVWEEAQYWQETCREQEVQHLAHQIMARCRTAGEFRGHDT